MEVVTLFSIQLTFMSNLVVTSFIFLLLAGCASSQDVSDLELVPFTRLPEQLKECSGMVYLGDGLYLGNNDSGNPPDLILFTLDHGDDIKRIRIKGTDNVDWEELATDIEFVYIGDTGNNNGSRKELSVYKVKKAEILDGLQANAERIRFTYPNQKNPVKGKKHNFDCEAMICIGDSLYVFTKNRGNGNTDVYSFPKLAGSYEARFIGSFAAGGLITGADFRMIDTAGELALVGYMVKDKGYHPFILHFKNVAVPGFFQSIPSRYIFSGKLQTETILFTEGNTVFISNEEEHGDQGYIYRVNLD